MNEMYGSIQANNVMTAGIQGGGASFGTTDHAMLANRDKANQHPISAITGLQSALDSKATETYVNAAISAAIADIDTLIGSGVI